MLLIALALSLFAGGARAADEEYVTGKDKILCLTQQSLREVMKAIADKNRDLMHTVQGCHYSIEGVHAEVVQDNLNMIKIRLGDSSQSTHSEVWTLPDSIRPANRR
jgi:hypothetical protein